MSVVVAKLGVGNTAAVMFAFERLGIDAALSDDATQISEAPRLVLPGVGAAAHAMALIDQRGLREVLRRFSRPLLGICLGQQLLFERSEEGDAQGLGRFPGAVTRLPSSPDAISPHMGWSRLHAVADHPLLEGVHEGDYAYFVHSYVCPLNQFTLAQAEYGQPFAAIVGDQRSFGCQFHPERSGAVGARILRNFAILPC
ncbi:MAG: imidazole glycerol phosphate synthase subunit HisH [Hyphomonadaceae bacterium]|nr:imidazole glycerol phosphate synthase subunit HisH [Hyphomonadaceae bacterium]MBX3510752.1 imidazole glycerol phosphate synthase subunit HisH [Hyphomonadaceae bacterium]